MGQPKSIRGIAVEAEGIDVEVEHGPIGCNNSPIVYQCVRPREHSRFIMEHRMRLRPGY